MDEESAPICDWVTLTTSDIEELIRNREIIRNHVCIRMGG